MVGCSRTATSRALGVAFRDGATDPSPSLFNICSPERGSWPSEARSEGVERGRSLTASFLRPMFSRCPCSPQTKEVRHPSDPGTSCAPTPYFRSFVAMGRRYSWRQIRRELLHKTAIEQLAGERSAYRLKTPSRSYLASYDAPPDHHDGTFEDRNVFGRIAFKEHDIGGFSLRETAINPRVAIGIRGESRHSANVR